MSHGKIVVTREKYIVYKRKLSPENYSYKIFLPKEIAEKLLDYTTDRTVYMILEGDILVVTTSIDKVLSVLEALRSYGQGLF